MKKTIAIVQSNYVPWKGYFDLMNSVDEFILYDDCQFTKNDWRNRNRIKTQNGLLWLTIPVRHRSLDQKINETECADSRWRKKHWSTLTQSYSKAPYFEANREIFEELYLRRDTSNLSEINAEFLEGIKSILGIETTLRSSSEFVLEGNQTERLMRICEQCGATTYVSGPAARSYFDVEMARKQGVSIKWMNYDGYEPYPQLHPPFEHAVSVLDLIFSTGPDASRYMKSFQDSPTNCIN